MLPGTDGITLMRTVPEIADLPVIFISGYGRDETIARALEAGDDDYIVKPFSPTEYDLLRVLAEGAGRVLTHEDLLRQVWAGRGTGNHKKVRAYVKRLRHRLGDDSVRPDRAINARGIGSLFLIVAVAFALRAPEAFDSVSVSEASSWLSATTRIDPVCWVHPAGLAVSRRVALLGGSNR